MDPFDKLASKFDTTFSKKIEDAVVAVQNEKQELTEQVNTTLTLPIVELKDRKYLEDRIKGLIDRTTNILDGIDRELSAGGMVPQAKAFMFKVYADVANAMSIQLRELRELAKTTMGLDMVNSESYMKANEAKQIEDGIKKKKFLMSGEDISNLIDAARNTSQMRGIKAEFKIVENTEG